MAKQTLLKTVGVQIQGIILYGSEVRGHERADVI